MKVTLHSRRGRRSASWRRFAVLAAVAPSLGACWESDACDPGQIIVDNLCYEALEPPAPQVDAGADAPLDTFGKACAVQADCAGGNAPLCAAPQLPLCTQIDCKPGEVNAGACPPGWQCLAVPPNPSVCLEL